MPSPTVTYAASTAASIQAAWDSLTRVIPPTPVTIDVPAGTYSEAITLSDQPYASAITIQGDTRAAAGERFAATGSIAKAGNNCTMTLTTTPPADFTSADYVIVCGTASAGNVGRFPIVSIDTVNKTVTYVNAAGVAEAVRTNTVIIFCPDRVIDFTGYATGVLCLCSASPVLTGFTILSSSSTTSTGVHVVGAASLTVAKCAVWNVHDNGFQTSNGAFLSAQGSCSAIKCTIGFFASKSSSMEAYDTYASDCVSSAYLANGGASLFATGAVAVNSTIGFQSGSSGTLYALSAVASYHSGAAFRAVLNGTVQCDGSTARNNSVAYHALWQGVLQALNTNANNSGNATNYSPPTSGTEGNNGGIINWS
jgi:hypothetical protein